MEKSENIFNDKDKRRGLIGTIIIHSIIVLALFFLALSTPLPLPGEEGVEVNVGDSDVGRGDIQEESAPPESQPIPPPPQETKPEQVEPDPVVEEENITQDVEEAPVIEEEKEEEPEEIIEEPEEVVEEEKEPEKVEEIVEEPKEETVDSTFISETEEVVEEIVEEPKPEVNQNALYPGTSKNEDGSNQGIKEGSGDMGKPQGYEDSDEYDGRGGEGNGPSFYLGGRGSRYLDIPKVTPKEYGNVVVDIWVDREGKVVKAQVKSKGTNVLDPDQKKMAVEAALLSKFEADPTAEFEQRGTITYTFVLLK